MANGALKLGVPRTLSNGSFSVASAFWDVAHSKENSHLFSVNLKQVLRQEEISGKKVLDIGCGDHFQQELCPKILSGIYLARCAGQYLGIDISQVAVKQSRNFHDSSENVQFLCGDARDLSFIPNQSFDIAVMYNMLCLLGSDFVSGVMESARVSKERVAFNMLHTDYVRTKPGDVMPIDGGVVVVDKDGMVKAGTTEVQIEKILAQSGFKIETLICQTVEDIKKVPGNRTKLLMFIDAVRA